MLEYKILAETSPEGITSFEDHVNRYIADGWEPLGGIQVVLFDQYFNKTFYQTMTRDKRKAEAAEIRQNKIKERASAGIDHVLEEYAEED